MSPVPIRNGLYAPNGDCIASNVTWLDWCRAIPVGATMGTRTESFLSDLIGFVQPGFSTHIMTAVGPGTNRVPGEANVVSADGLGKNSRAVVENAMDFYLRDNKGNLNPKAKVVAYAYEGLSVYQQEAIVKGALKFVGCKYDYRGFASFVLQWGNDDGRFFCSELGAHVMLRCDAVQIRIFPLGYDPHKVGPGVVDKWMLSEEATQIPGIRPYVAGTWGWHWDDAEDRDWFYNKVLGNEDRRAS